MMGALYGVLMAFFSNMYGGFRLGYIEKWNAIYSQILSAIIVNAITYFQISLLAYGFPELVPFAALLLADIFIILIWGNCYYAIYQHLFPPRKLFCIYGSESALDIISKIQKREDRYAVEKKVSVQSILRLDGKCSAESVELIRKSEGVLLCDINTEIRNQILKMCFDNSIRVYMTPKISDILVRGSEELHIMDTPILLARNGGLNPEQRIGKRIMDIFISLIILMVTSPIMLITAIFVKVFDWGPVIYKQCRLTEGGRQFYIYKFRSMKIEAERDGIARLATANDDRITPFGKLIRAVRIDELPQLFNVLKGEMSLVGPRPERPEIAEEYQKVIPQFSSRLKVKAGLTGYAQIYGKYNTTAYDKLKLDLTYIQNYSVLLDFKLLIQTVKILFMKESTEGVS